MQIYSLLPNSQGRLGNLTTLHPDWTLMCRTLVNPETTLAWWECNFLKASEKSWLWMITGWKMRNQHHITDFCNLRANYYYIFLGNLQSSVQNLCKVPSCSVASGNLGVRLFWNGSTDLFLFAHPEAIMEQRTLIPGVIARHLWAIQPAFCTFVLPLSHPEFRVLCSAMSCSISASSCHMKLFACLFLVLHLAWTCFRHQMPWVFSVTCRWRCPRCWCSRHALWYFLTKLLKHVGPLFHVGCNFWKNVHPSLCTYCCLTKSSTQISGDINQTLQHDKRNSEQPTKCMLTTEK